MFLDKNTRDFRKKQKARVFRKNTRVFREKTREKGPEMAETRPKIDK